MTPTASHYVVQEMTGDAVETYALDSLEEALELRAIIATTPGSIAFAFVVLTDGDAELL